MKFVLICSKGLPQKERYFLKKILEEFEILGVKYLERENDIILTIKTEGYEPADGLLITSIKCFDDSLIESGLTTVVYDENEGKGLPYGIDLIAGSFEDIGADFLKKLWCHKNDIPCIIAETKRTVMREICKADLDEVIEISRQEHILKFVKDGRTSENEQREKLLAYIENIYKFYDFGIWGIFDKENKLIGTISLDLLKSTENAEYEVGFFIRKEKLGLGFGREALEAVMSYAKNNLRALRLVAVTDKENVSAIKLLVKSGFEPIEADETASLCFVNNLR